MIDYLVIVAMGIIGLYMFRDWALDRQRRKDAERAENEESEEKERMG